MSSARLLCASSLLLAGAVSLLSARTVALTLSPRLAGRTLWIEGTTDLPDRTMLDWELRHTQRYELMKTVPFELMTNEGRVMVRNGRYSTAVRLADWPEGDIEVWVGFQPVAYGGPQPAFITRVFGENGERLEGDNIETNGQFRNMFRAWTATYVWISNPPRGRESEALRPVMRIELPFAARPARHRVR
jgi:hypothetical protein